jgi:hypothetical protein
MSWVLLAVLALLALLQGGAAQFCSFWNNDCIEPLAQSAVPFSFQPLFPDPITLYYGFDASSSGKGQGPMTKTAFWLEYQDRNINKYAIDTNRTTEIGLRVGNLTGSPSGPNNGCDGIWGPGCSRDIKNAVQHGIFSLSSTGERYHRPLEIALSQMMSNPPPMESCGSQVFDVASIPVHGTSDFALETKKPPCGQLHADTAQSLSAKAYLRKTPPS